MTDDIRDIHGPIVQAASTPWWPYVLVGAAAVVLAYAVWCIVRARRRPLPADQRALRELAEARGLIERDHPHELSLRVSETVRGYVETAFDIDAPRRTTAELLDDLMRVASPVAPYRGELGAFLELCDLAKYARWSLSRGQMTEIVDRAERFIRACAKPAEETS